jgi:O-acetyl-ADP-ribose deacetylase (regulator of RNase III)
MWIQKYGALKTGSCAFTTAGTLKSKFIVHTPGPIWTSYTEKKSIELLKSCITKSLDMSINSAKLGEINSISFPLISSGNFGGPENLIATTLLDTIVEWCLRPHTGKLKTIQICSIFENQIQFFKTEFQRFSKENYFEEEKV